MPSGDKEDPYVLLQDILYMKKPEPGNVNMKKGGFLRLILRFMEPLKFALSSLLSFGFDYTFFLTLKSVADLGYTPAYFIARFASNILNFTLNRNMVFDHRAGVFTFWNSFFQYFSLAFFIMLIGSVMMQIYTEVVHLDGAIVKPVIDLSLFAVSYFVQKQYIFRKQDSMSIG